MRDVVLCCGEGRIDQKSASAAQGPEVMPLQNSMPRTPTDAYFQTAPSYVTLNAVQKSGSPRLRVGQQRTSTSAVTWGFNPKET